MSKKFWWPTILSEQAMTVQNFQAKIGNYAAALGLSAADIADAPQLCEAIAGSLSYAENCRTTMLAITQWRDLVLNGELEGTNAPAPPAFSSGGSPSYKVGSLKLFFKLRARIVSSPGYTMAIGEDLGIVGVEGTARPASDVTPRLRATVVNGNTVSISGSLQGMDALRVEYSKTGGEFAAVAFLTKTPGGFQINTAAPNTPETGFIRAVFIKKNEEYGNFSPNYPVTVS